MRRITFFTIMAFSICAVAAAVDTKTLTLDGSQLEQNVVLSAEKMRTEYQSQVVPDTCYKDVQQGTKQECTTPTHQECTPASHQECGYEENQKCEYGPDRQECGYGPSHQECDYGPDRQECDYGPSQRECSVVPGPDVCSTTYTNECKDERDCEVVNGVRECRTHQVCVQVPHESCHSGPDTRECHDVPGSYECHTVPGSYECHTVSGDYECHTVSGEYECHTEYGAYKCETVRDPDVCHTVSDPQVCKTVPNIVKVPYACTKTIQVPIQVKDFDTQAKVRVLMAQLPKDIKVSEKLNLSLVEDKLGYTLGSLSGNLDNKTIWFLEKNIAENKAGNLKTIEALLKLTALPVEALKAPISQQPKIALSGEVLTVQLPTAKYPELYKMTFDLLRDKTLFNGQVHVNKVIALEKLNVQNLNGKSVVSIELKDLGLSKEKRKSGKYKTTIVLEAVVDNKKAVNPAAIPTTLKITGSTELKLK